MTLTSHGYADVDKFSDLGAKGRACLEADDINGLRQVVVELHRIQIDHSSETDMAELANVIRG